MKYFLCFQLIFLTFCEPFNDDGVACTTQFVYGLNVIVKDANTNDIIIDGIEVVASEDEYEEQLMNIPGSTNFVGAGERPGNYIIEISSDDYADYVSDTIEVGADECHVIPEVIEIFLTPN